MPKFLATYDLKETVNKPHAAMLEAASQNGWYLWVLASNGSKYRLPNTTLDGDFPDYAMAYSAFERALTQARAKVGPIVLEKWVISQYVDLHLDSDQKVNAAA
jgi:hypothetical protein